MVGVLPRRDATRSIAARRFFSPSRRCRTPRVRGVPERRDSCPPCAEVLGGDILPGDLLKVFIDVGGRNVLQVSLIVDILKEFLTRQLLAGLYDFGDSPIFYGHRPFLSAFAGELKPELGTVDGNVPISQRRQAIAVILPGVIIIANADEHGSSR
jgi:hypothetical protein